MLADEEKEFERFLENDPGLKTIYDNCFSKTKTYTDEEILEAEKSYAVHYVKMHLRRDRS